MGTHELCVVMPVYNEQDAIGAVLEKYLTVVNYGEVQIWYNTHMIVSVVIPVYNQAPFLNECLDSVLAQTLRDIEVVCVDDGSTDGSSRILDEYASRDSRVKVIHQENHGVGPARNTGMDVAQGEFVAFMDPDDKYPDDGVLSDLVRGAEANGVDVSGGSLLMMDGRHLEPDFTFDADGVRDYADYQFGYGFSRYLYRRRLLADSAIRFPALVRFQDVPFCIEALHAAGRFCALRRISYLYRDGHHTVEWSENGGFRAVAHVTGLTMAYDLARQYGYGKMAEQMRTRLLDFVRLLCSESTGLRTDLMETRTSLAAARSDLDAARSNLGVARSDLEGVRSELNVTRAELEDLKSSESYRLGLFLTWPARKVKKFLEGITCSSRS
jgi:glycosyltransferase involved in cell wall biosynthesis